MTTMPPGRISGTRTRSTRVSKGEPRRAMGPSAVGPSAVGPGDDGEPVDRPAEPVDRPAEHEGGDRAPQGEARDEGRGRPAALFPAAPGRAPMRGRSAHAARGHGCAGTGARRAGPRPVRRRARGDGASTARRRRAPAARGRARSGRRAGPVAVSGRPGRSGRAVLPARMARPSLRAMPWRPRNRRPRNRRPKSRRPRNRRSRNRRIAPRPSRRPRSPRTRRRASAAASGASSGRRRIGAPCASIHPDRRPPPEGPGLGSPCVRSGARPARRRRRRRPSRAAAARGLAPPATAAGTRARSSREGALDRPAGLLRQSPRSRAVPRREPSAIHSARLPV